MEILAENISDGFYFREEKKLRRPLVRVFIFISIFFQKLVE
jgi:hypothetical protein